MTTFGFPRAAEEAFSSRSTEVWSRVEDVEQGHPKHVNTMLIMHETLTKVVMLRFRIVGDLCRLRCVGQPSPTIPTLRACSSFLQASMFVVVASHRRISSCEICFLLRLSASDKRMRIMAGGIGANLCPGEVTQAAKMYQR